MAPSIYALWFLCKMPTQLLSQIGIHIQWYILSPRLVSLHPGCNVAQWKNDCCNTILPVKVQWLQAARYLVCLVEYALVSFLSCLCNSDVWFLVIWAGLSSWVNFLGIKWWDIEIWAPVRSCHPFIYFVLCSPIDMSSHRSGLQIIIWAGKLLHLILLVANRTEAVRT